MVGTKKYTPDALAFILACRLRSFSDQAIWTVFTQLYPGRKIDVSGIRYVWSKYKGDPVYNPEKLQLKHCRNIHADRDEMDEVNEILDLIESDELCSIPEDLAEDDEIMVRGSRKRTEVPVQEQRGLNGQSNSSHMSSRHTQTSNTPTSPHFTPSSALFAHLSPAAVPAVAPFAPLPASYPSNSDGYGYPAHAFNSYGLAQNNINGSKTGIDFDLADLGNDNAASNFSMHNFEHSQNQFTLGGDWINQDFLDPRLHAEQSCPNTQPINESSRQFHGHVSLDELMRNYQTYREEEETTQFQEDAETTALKRRREDWESDVPSREPSSPKRPRF